MMYRVKVGEIRDLWKIVGPFKTYGKRNRDDRWPGLQAGLRCVTRLTKPVTFDALKRDPATHDLPIMRKRFVGKTDITDYWPLLYNRIVSLNPKAMQALDKYRFDR
jgi:hypothetical protein